MVDSLLWLAYIDVDSMGGVYSEYFGGILEQLQ